MPARIDVDVNKVLEGLRVRLMRSDGAQETAPDTAKKLKMRADHICLRMHLGEGWQQASHMHDLALQAEECAVLALMLAITLHAAVRAENPDTMKH